MALTNAVLKNSKPRLKPYKIFDGRGMFLLVNPNGSRYWRLKYRFGGKEKLLAFGTYPEVSLKVARERRADARKLLSEGKDPGAERKSLKRTARIKAANNFEAVSRECIEKHANRWTPQHAENWRRRFEADIFPELGHRPIAEIDAPELLSVIRKVEARGAFDMAHRLLQMCGQVFRYGIATGRCGRDPAADLRGALTPHVKKHIPAIRPEELPELLAKIDAYEGEPQTRLALQLLTLTFVRTKELIGAGRQEFDLERAMWVIPAERMKMKAEHLVPLSRQAVYLINELSAFNTDSRYLLTGRNPLKPMSANTMLFGLYRLGYRGRMTGHGFRTVASTILNEHGFSPDAIERQLAHCERNSVRGAYNRAEYLNERWEMMQWWADYLDQLRGGNVIPARFGKTV